MKNWKKGMIAGSIICIATGFLFIGIGSSMGGWKNIDQDQQSLYSFRRQ